MSRGVAFQRLQRRAGDDRGVVAREVVGAQQFANFHLDQFQQLGVVDHVGLVHVHHDVRVRQPDVPAGCARGSAASGRQQPNTPGSRRPSAPHR